MYRYVNGSFNKMITVDCKNAAWLPLYKLEDNQWVDFNNRSELVTSNFEIKSDGKDIQRCAYMMPIGSEAIGDTTCNKKNCAFCIWSTRAAFELRGLCRRSIIQRNYVLSHKLHSNGVMGKLI